MATYSYEIPPIHRMNSEDLVEKLKSTFHRYYTTPLTTEQDRLRQELNVIMHEVEERLRQVDSRQPSGL